MQAVVHSRIHQSMNKEKQSNDVLSESVSDIDSGRTVQKVKVVTVGDISVGKSSLALRFTRGVFEDQYKPTVGAVFVFRTVNYCDRKIIFQIWDTAGQERFKSLVPMYLRDAKFALLVYDITDRRSFEAIPSWLRYVEKYAPPDIKIALVGNKIDLKDQQYVDHKDARHFAQQHGILFEEVSAKTGQNVDSLFETLAKILPAEVVRKKIPVNPKINMTEEEPSLFRCCKIR